MEILVLLWGWNRPIPNWLVAFVLALALVGAWTVVSFVFGQVAIWWSAGVIVWPAVVRFAEGLPDVEQPSLPLAERARG
jgi:hypothetical protein